MRIVGSNPAPSTMRQPPPARQPANRQLDQDDFYKIALSAMLKMVNCAEQGQMQDFEIAYQMAKQGLMALKSVNKMRYQQILDFIETEILIGIYENHNWRKNLEEAQ